MNPESPNRVRRSSILKVPRPAGPRSPLQILETNQTIFDYPQDEDRTTVTRTTTFKRRVSFSRTNRVQEFCLENPQAPTSHIWGPAYEKELSPEPSPYISGNTHSNTHSILHCQQPTSDFQNLLCNQIKTSVSFSSVERTSVNGSNVPSLFGEISREVEHQPWKEQEQIVSQQELLMQGMRTNNNEDMDITGQNSEMSIVPSLTSNSLDKENLKLSSIRTDFMSRILQERTTNTKAFNANHNNSSSAMPASVAVSTTLGPPIAAFPNIQLELDSFEEDNSDIHLKESSSKYMLNQTCVIESDVDMSMSTCSMVEDQEIDEMNLDVNSDEKKIEQCNIMFENSLKNLNGFSNVTVNMDMTEHYTNKISFPKDHNTNEATDQENVQHSFATFKDADSNDFSMMDVTHMSRNQYISGTPVEMEMTMNKSSHPNAGNDPCEESVLGFTASELLAPTKLCPLMQTSQTFPLGKNSDAINIQPNNSMNLTLPILSVNTIKTFGTNTEIPESCPSLLHESKSLITEDSNLNAILKEQISPSASTLSDNQTTDLTHLDKSLEHASKTLHTWNMNLTPAYVTMGQSLDNKTMDLTHLDKTVGQTLGSQTMNITCLNKSETQHETSVPSALDMKLQTGSKPVDTPLKTQDTTSFNNEDMNISCNADTVKYPRNVVQTELRKSVSISESLVQDKLAILSTTLNHEHKLQNESILDYTMLKTHDGLMEISEFNKTADVDLDKTKEIEPEDEHANFLSSTLNKSNAPNSLLASQEFEVIQEVESLPHLLNNNESFEYLESVKNWNVTNDMKIPEIPSSPISASIMITGNEDIHDMDVTEMVENDVPIFSAIKEKTLPGTEIPIVDMNITRNITDMKTNNNFKSHISLESTMNSTERNTVVPNIAIDVSVLPNIAVDGSVELRNHAASVQSSNNDTNSSVPHTDLELKQHSSIIGSTLEKPNAHLSSLGNKSPEISVSVSSPTSASSRKISQSATEMGIMNEICLPLPVAALNKTSCLDSSICNYDLSPTLSPSGQEMPSETEIVKTSEYELKSTRDCKSETEKVLQKTRNETFTIEASQVNENDALVDVIESTENIKTNYLHFNSSNLEKIVSVGKITIDDKIGNKKCEIESCEIFENVRATDLSPTTEVEVTKVHIAEDIELVQVNDRTGQILHKVKHFDIKEVIEHQHSEECIQQSPKTKINLTMNEELFLSSQQNSCDIEAQDIPECLSTIDLDRSRIVQPQKKLVQHKKRSADYLEEENISNKKLCNEIEPIVPDIVIVPPTPLEETTFKIQSPNNQEHHIVTNNFEHLDMQMESSESEETSQNSQEMKFSSPEIQKTELSASCTLFDSQEVELVTSEIQGDIKKTVKRKSDEPVSSMTMKLTKLDEDSVKPVSPDENMELEVIPSVAKEISTNIMSVAKPVSVLNECKPHLPLALEDYLKKLSKMKRSVWRIVRLDQTDWQFAILCGTAILNLKITGDGKISKTDFLRNIIANERLSRAHKIVWQFCLTQLEKKFSNSTILEIYRETSDVLNLLHDLEPTLISLTTLGHGLAKAARFFVLEFGRSYVQFSASSFKLHLLVKVRLDLSDLDNLSPNHVSVNIIHGSINVDDLKNLLGSGAHKEDVLLRFIKNVRDYVINMEEIYFDLPLAWKNVSK